MKHSLRYEHRLFTVLDTEDIVIGSESLRRGEIDVFLEYNAFTSKLAKYESESG